MSDTAEEYKRQAAERAVESVASGMSIGLGHGTTAIYALRRLAVLLHQGALQNLCCVPCSNKVEAEARQLGLPLTTLEEHPELDLTIDGADEVAPNLDVIKGGGGALLREKIVAQASRREIIVVDESKMTDVLGARSAVPVEVLPFGWRSQYAYLEALGARVSQRLQADQRPWVSDGGNFIFDCAFGPLADPAALAEQLQARAGIIQHGLFLGLASEVIVSGSAGIRRLTRDR
ncbi:MAG TPA: ribose-5-phosphate isomerase RpiA [Armatimonadota bacterium]|jgi:ribose 5-phosphate isomerase A